MNILDLKLARGVGHRGDDAIGQFILHRFIIFQPLHSGGRVGG